MVFLLPILVMAPKIEADMSWSARSPSTLPSGSLWRKVRDPRTINMCTVPLLGLSPALPKWPGHLMAELQGPWLSLAHCPSPSGPIVLPCPFRVQFEPPLQFLVWASWCWVAPGSHTVCTRPRDPLL
uniref:VFLL3057 n=1 Tax=Homo sapiens TaxID=9606 RepID=Q6UY40_HUMAN|nr:VFLL3057 [Homo sapiens]